MADKGAARLITIPISHYCERARWALDHVGLRYEHEPHLQLFHRRPVSRSGGGRTVPVLVTEHGDVLTDSTDIVHYADTRATPQRRLYPEDVDGRREVEALEDAFTVPLGVAGRRVMYDHFFRWGRGALRFNGGGAPWWQRATAYAGFEVIRRYARGYLQVNPAAVAASQGEVDRIFDDVATRLRDGRGYLWGDRFSAADLTFACMAAPLIAPAPYGTRLPTPEEVPDATRALLEAHRAHPAGAFALRMFREHRQLPS